MPNAGKLVRMENGRWARFERLTVWEQGRPANESLWVAVELDDAAQAQMNLNEAAVFADDAVSLPVSKSDKFLFA